MVTIRQQLVPAAVAAKVTSAGTSRRTGITIHETGNRSRGANAAAHANLQAKGNSRSASWHWTVDDKEAVQSFPHTARCWHAGDGTKGGYDTVAIEICVNEDGDYAKALANAAELVLHIRATDPSVGGALVQHHHWSGKNCPTRLRAGEAGGWSGFLDRVAGATPVAKPAPAPAPKPAPAKPAQIEVDGAWGSDTTRRLQSVLGTPVDGVVSRQASKHRAASPGLTSGWDWTGRTGDGGSRVIAALQKRLGVADDGKIGPATIKALQRHLGTPVDGVVSKPSRMVTALQERLNAGRL